MKMIYLFVLLFATLGNSYVLENESPKFRAERSTTLKAPSINKIVAVEPKSLFIEWSKVEPSGKDDEPTIGYKVRVWEIKGVTTYHYVTNDMGTSVLVQDETHPESWSTDVTKTADTEPVDITVPSDTTNTTIKDLKDSVWYEVRVLSYSKSGDGPLSSPVRYSYPKKP